MACLPIGAADSIYRVCLPGTGSLHTLLRPAPWACPPSAAHGLLPGHTQADKPLQNHLEVCELNAVRKWLGIKRGGTEALQAIALLCGGDYAPGANKVVRRVAVVAVQPRLPGIAPSILTAQGCSGQKGCAGLLAVGQLCWCLLALPTHTHTQICTHTHTHTRAHTYTHAAANQKPTAVSWRSGGGASDLCQCSVAARAQCRGMGVGQSGCVWQLDLVCFANHTSLTQASSCQSSPSRPRPSKGRMPACTNLMPRGTHTHTCTHTHRHRGTQAQAQAYTHTHTGTHIHTGTQAHAHTGTRTYRHTHTHTHRHTHTHTRTHTHRHTHTHTGTEAHRLRHRRTHTLTQAHTHSHTHTHAHAHTHTHAGVGNSHSRHDQGHRFAGGSQHDSGAQHSALSERQGSLSVSASARCQVRACSPGACSAGARQWMLPSARMSTWQMQQ